MKISKEKKAQIRTELINSAIELFFENGIEKTSMRAIAQKAGYSTATVYNYFSNREKILFAFFEDRAERTLLETRKIPDFSEFNLKEKLQAQLELGLDIFLEDREFISIAHDLMLTSPFKMLNELECTRNIHLSFIKETLENAIENGEIPQQPMPNLIASLYWDYAALMIIYWMKDESPNFEKTSELIDKSLDLIIELLKSNLLQKSSDIVLFIFKSHFQSTLENIDGLFDTLTDLRQKLAK